MIYHQDAKSLKFHRNCNFRSGYQSPLRLRIVWWTRVTRLLLCPMPISVPSHWVLYISSLFRLKLSLSQVGKCRKSRCVLLNALRRVTSKKSRKSMVVKHNWQNVWKFVGKSLDYVVFVFNRKFFENCATRLFADLCKIMQEKGAQTLGISGPFSTSYVSLSFLVTGCRSLNQFREFHPFSPLILGVILFL